MFLINIVLMNLLIAIVGDIFDQIQESARAQFLYSEAKLIIDFESLLMPKGKADPRKFPQWLQVLKPAADDAEGNDEGWTGKLRALKKEMVRRGEKTEIT